ADRPSEPATPGDPPPPDDVRDPTDVRTSGDARQPVDTHQPAEHRNPRSGWLRGLLGGQSPSPDEPAPPVRESGPVSRQRPKGGALGRQLFRQEPPDADRQDEH